MKNHPKPLVITAGEPAGIGPDIILKLASQGCLTDCVVIADPTLLAERSKQLKLNISIQCTEPNQNYEGCSPGALMVLPIALKSPCAFGKLNPANSSYVVETLQAAAVGCLNKEFSGIVTGPIHKGIINEAGIPFKGHTEFFAHISGAPAVVMMLICNKMRVALATTHLPLAQVPLAITAPLIEQTLRILRSELVLKFYLRQPKILICGLNPHAGEGGHLGKEEEQILIPIIKKLQAEGFDLEGPLSADTIFTPKYLQKADVVLAMYHDQGLPVIKYADFGQVVNVTLGLPFVRASVDHGTALELAGSGKADSMSFKAAIDWIRQLELSHPS